MQNSLDLILTQLNQIYKESDEVYHNVAARFGLSDSALWLLYSLGGSPRALTQSEICENWFVSKQTLHSTLQKLVADGYLEKHAAMGSRKEKQIVLTDAGRALMQATVVPMKQAEKRALAAFSPEEQALLLSLSRRQMNYLRQELSLLSPDTPPAHAE